MDASLIRAARITKDSDAFNIAGLPFASRHIYGRLCERLSKKDITDFTNKGFSDKQIVMLDLYTSSQERKKLAIEAADRGIKSFLEYICIEREPQRRKPDASMSRVSAELDCKDMLFVGLYSGMLNGGAELVRYASTADDLKRICSIDAILETIGDDAPKEALKQMPDCRSQLNRACDLYIAYKDMVIDIREDYNRIKGLTQEAKRLISGGASADISSARSIIEEISKIPQRYFQDDYRFFKVLPEALAAAVSQSMADIKNKARRDNVLLEKQLSDSYAMFIDSTEDYIRWNEEVIKSSSQSIFSGFDNIAMLSSIYGGDITLVSQIVDKTKSSLKLYEQHKGLAAEINSAKSAIQEYAKNESSFSFGSDSLGQSLDAIRHQSASIVERCKRLLERCPQYAHLDRGALETSSMMEDAYKKINTKLVSIAEEKENQYIKLANSLEKKLCDQRSWGDAVASLYPLHKDISIRIRILDRFLERDTSQIDTLIKNIEESYNLYVGYLPHVKELRGIAQQIEDYRRCTLELIKKEEKLLNILPVIKARRDSLQDTVNEIACQGIAFAGIASYEESLGSAFKEACDAVDKELTGRAQRYLDRFSNNVVCLDNMLDDWRRWDEDSIKSQNDCLAADYLELTAVMQSVSIDTLEAKALKDFVDERIALYDTNKGFKEQLSARTESIQKLKSEASSVTKTIADRYFKVALANASKGLEEAAADCSKTAEGSPTFAGIKKSFEDLSSDAVSARSSMIGTIKAHMYARSRALDEQSTSLTGALADWKVWDDPAIDMTMRDANSLYRMATRLSKALNSISGIGDEELGLFLSDRKNLLDKMENSYSEYMEVKPAAEKLSEDLKSYQSLFDGTQGCLKSISALLAKKYRIDKRQETRYEKTKQDIKKLNEHIVAQKKQLQGLGYYDDYQDSEVGGFGKGIVEAKKHIESSYGICQDSISETLEKISMRSKYFNRRLRKQMGNRKFWKDWRVEQGKNYLSSLELVLLNLPKMQDPAQSESYQDIHEMYKETLDMNEAYNKRVHKADRIVTAVFGLVGTASAAGLIYYVYELFNNGIR